MQTETAASRPPDASGTHPFRTYDARLEPISARVLAGERLSFDDGLALYASPDVLAVGWLANHVRERMHGDVTYFNVNRHINPTNVCVAACRLCAFGRKMGDPASYTMGLEQAWQTEWMRIREVETEHFLMDIHGMFYELQPLPFENRIWGVKPICQHLRIIPDFCAYRGMFAVGGNQTTPNADNYAVAGQPQSGIWFGKTDDLWSWGKPAGWGGPWWKSSVKKGVASDPFLLTGFEHKMVHINTDKATDFVVEIDFIGDGTWNRYDVLKVPAEGYQKHIFPDAFSAHWVRLIPQSDCRVTASFFFV